MARMTLAVDDLPQQIDMLMGPAVEMVEALGPPVPEDEPNGSDAMYALLRRPDSTALGVPGTPYLSLSSRRGRASRRGWWRSSP